MNGAGSRLALAHRFSRALVGLYFGVLCRVRVYNARLPAGGFVISMNHRSAWDMVLYWAILPRRIKFLAKKELFHYPLLGRILARWCIPVDRGRYDRKAFALCLEALRAGFVLSVFPEGTRHAQLAAGHGGAVLMAAKAGVPVLPGAIAGGYRPFDTLTVRFGAPLHYPPELNKEQRQQATTALMDTIRALGATATPRRPPRFGGRRKRGRRMGAPRDRGGRERAV